MPGGEGGAMTSTERKVLRQMNARIKQIEDLALELKQLGQDVPVIQKNAEVILSTVYVLKFGISDIVEIDTA